MNVTRVISFVIACLASFPTFSAPPEKIGIDIGSWHTKPGFNNVNPGAYAVWKGGYIVGAFYNSFEHTTVHAGKLWNVGDSGKFGVYTGLGTGYEWPLVPLIVPSMALPLGRGVSARISVMLDPRPDTAQALHLSVERQF